MNREQLQHLALAGTVTFPATFPQLAQLSLEPVCLNADDQACGVAATDELLVATERTSPKVTVRRKLLVSNVSGLFIPNHPQRVDFGDGYWFLKGEIASGLAAILKERKVVLGIAYVHEHVATILELSAGMTAAESSQYYPPLPCDRSVNHYDPTANTSALATGSGTDSEEAASVPPLDPSMIAGLNQMERSLRPLQCSRFDPVDFPEPI